MIYALWFLYALGCSFALKYLWPWVVAFYYLGVVVCCEQRIRATHARKVWRQYLQERTK